LLHHGFGRMGIDPLTADYPARFGKYARDVARRYPGLDAFLPVNEPLTTARFGGLYGWWPPYGRDDTIFVRLLVAQCLAFREAAQAIRRERPDATIIVSEDAGRTYGTPEVAAAVEHGNHRRWLTFDLLTGRVDRGHPLWAYLRSVPDVQRGLDILAAEPASPDVLGLNYYITSDRFLDHRLERYPADARGGDGALAYADVELVRVASPELSGFSGAIREAWARYGRPIALTEVQLAADPPDQVAWWVEAWRAAEDAARDGIAIQGVTTWAAFGAWEWRHLLRRRTGSYEAGAFDSRDGAPRAGALASAVARTAAVRDPGAAGVGWWRRPERVLYGPEASREPRPSDRAA
jgi:dTDP-4-dehydrorhamnose reductase